MAFNVTMSEYWRRALGQHSVPHHCRSSRSRADEDNTESVWLLVEYTDRTFSKKVLIYDDASAFCRGCKFSLFFLQTAPLDTAINNKNKLELAESIVIWLGDD